MDALFIHVATKLEAERFGDNLGNNKFLDIKELKTVVFWRAVFAEFLATMLFVFLGCAATLSGTGTAKEVKIAFTFGLAIMAMIQMVGHVSGGHINPAVTLAMTVAMKNSVIRAVFYILGQCGGAIIGAFILRGLTPDMFHDNLGVNNIASITTAQGFGIEFLLTFVLVIVIFGTTDGNRPAFGSQALLIGLTVTLGHVSSISFTGASMNPARSLGSAVASNSWDNHWIYWVGPILGGVLAALVYKLILSPYKNVKPMDEAMKDMIQDDNFIVIPRDYFKDGKSKANHAKDNHAKDNHAYDNNGKDNNSKDNNSKDNNTHSISRL